MDPHRWQNDDSALFAGEWFEIARPEHDPSRRGATPLR
ncbi:DUF1419 domain-containing protein [Mesorhizobium sp. WSM2561]|nr:DUF1419 domain-containing protein [Mesorhizobium sp. WSM2561]